MSIIGDVASGFSKFASFVTRVFSKTAEIIEVIRKLSPRTIAVLLAVFYDVTKAAATIEKDIATKNYADLFSEGTQTLIREFILDVRAGEQILVEDAKQLALAITSSK